MNVLDFVKNLYKKIIKKDKFEAVEDKSFKDFVAVINLAIGFKYSGYFALIPSNLNIGEHLERAVVELAIENPALGQVRVSNELKKKGFSVSAGGVRIWLRHN